MASNWVYGFEPGSFTSPEPGKLRLDPSYDTTDDQVQINVVDDDVVFDGDNGADEAGEDTNQNGAIYDASGNFIGNGQIYLEEVINLSDGYGNTVKLYVLEIAGTPVGYLSDGPIQPGATYTVDSTENVTSANAPDYSDFWYNSYEQDLNNDADGTTNDDVLTTGAGSDTIDGGAGDDSIDGAGGSDYISAGSGDDSVDGGFGRDTIYGESGNDRIFGEGGNDYISGGSGTDSIVGGDGADTIFGDGDNDTIQGGGGNDSIYGGDGDDRLAGSDGDDVIYGGAGNDVYDTDLGNDTFYGGDGDDWAAVYHNMDGEVLYGGNTAETVGDTLEVYGDFAGAAVDITLTSDGSGVVSFAGESANFYQFERFYSYSGDDVFDGSAGATDLYVYTASGDDIVYGGAGSDSLVSGSGNDYLFGDLGNDMMFGGDGNDEFSVSLGHDTVSDFNFGNTGTLDDGDSYNNDFLDVGGYYDHISELYADQADDNILNQSNTTDSRGNAVDYSDNSQFGPNSSIYVQGASADSSSFTEENTGVVCFTSGTSIRTPGGDVLIDDLKVGDLVSTLDNGAQPIRWIGRRKLGQAELAANPHQRPILIKRGLLGAERDLLVSPQHGMLMPDQSLVRAKFLTETLGSQIRVAHGRRSIEYIHLLFEEHQIIFAENTRSESLYPGKMAFDAMNVAAQSELKQLFPCLNKIKPQATEYWYGHSARTYLSRREVVLERPSFFA